MSKVKLYTQDGKQAGEMDLNPKFFDVAVNPALVHEVTVAQQANARRTIANTKTRGEVRGGGIKPWKQKGTGRARQGSIRSPQWVGGGITFGPRAIRNFTVKVNRRVKQKALFMALSDKVKSDLLFVLEDFKPSAVKTKQAATLFKTLPVNRSVLAIIPASNPELIRMVRNLQNVKVVTVNAMNIADVLKYRTVVFWKDAIPAFESLYRNA